MIVIVTIPLRDDAEPNPKIEIFLYFLEIVLIHIEDQRDFVKLPFYVQRPTG
jgi:hypothetical protein